MSTATTVPETYELQGDHAVETLRRTGRGRLVKNAIKRFRAADGFSHTRSLAFITMLAILPGFIALVGLTQILHATAFRRVVEASLVKLAPGPAGKVLTQAFSQGTSSGRTALVAGLAAAIFSGTVAMGQVERGANRIYGIERDRRTLRKYATAFLLAISVGVLSVVAVLLMVAGGALGDALGRQGGWSDALTTTLSILRWPIAAILVVVSFAVLFKLAPRRHQPAASWLAVGAVVSVILWIAFTGLLALYVSGNSTFGQTYGPLTGIIAALLWSFLTALALFLGIAFAAQLEAVRAGVPRPDAAPGLQEEGLPGDLPLAPARQG